MTKRDKIIDLYHKIKIREIITSILTSNLNINFVFITNVMTTLTSPTNESYSVAYSDPNRLQVSHIGSLPQELVTDSKKQFLEFEEYGDAAAELSGTMQVLREEEKHKNGLKIAVEDNFECRIVDVPGMRNKRHVAFENYPNQKEDIGRLNETILNLNGKVEELEERIRILEAENCKLEEKIEFFIEEKENFVIKHEHFKQIIWKKDETISSQKQTIEALNSKLAEFEKDNHNVKFNQQKTKQKDLKIRELIKKIDKLLQINKSLEKQLALSGENLIMLEKQIQTQAYNQILENRVKLKESISHFNKENLDQNHRKSFENPQRKGRLSNISAFEKKGKSTSNTGRIKH